MERTTLDKLISWRSLSKEGIRASLDACLLADDVASQLRALFASPVGAELLPEVSALDMDQRGRQLHKDNLEHTIVVVAQSPARLRLRWAALLHDIGKPPTRRIVGSKVSFHQHEAVGERLARKLLLNLGYDEGFAHEVSRLVGISGRMHGFDESWTDSAVRRFSTDAGDLTHDALDLSRADCTSKHAWRRQQVRAQVDAVAQRVEEVKAADAAAAVRPALDGNEIMKILGLGPGRHIGEARAFLMELEQVEGPLEPSQAAAALRDWWSSRDR